MEEQHEVYGGEIPEEEGEMEADEEMHAAGEYEEDVDPQSSKENLEEMKKRLKEIEEEAGALREMQAKVEKEMSAVQGPSPPSFSVSRVSKIHLVVLQPKLKKRKRILGQSMLVDYACTPEEVQQHFQSCGTVNRVTILTDKFGQPKGFAYVEFVEVEAVQNALLLNESELHGRQLKVSAKRTNVPGMKQYRGRRPSPYPAFRSRRPFMPTPFYSPFGYGKVPRFRRPMRYRPYY
ncbi:polyadenylate-binding protein 2-like isoform X1 [Iris pallida]|uniref:Polyadenylate-binding protein 2-like isoform X1 n=1 Tax=Iris pallida TaxID=29817 RepID=A0AAX6F0T7_IRIPA|nr:polyadenylate-binding protein 2-like isoform X1 [Iris pallida]KAJ6845097.1 polyadenylate-binding protein 2-like isoform X1 [Iris pallida]